MCGVALFNPWCIEITFCLAQALPQCLALHFAAADVQEASGQPQAAAQIYEALLPVAPAAAEGEAATPKVELTAEQQALVWVQYMRFVRRSEGRDKSRKVCGLAF